MAKTIHVCVFCLLSQLVHMILMLPVILSKEMVKFVYIVVEE